MKHLYLILLAALLCACSNDKSFKVSGEISGSPTMNIYVKYYAAGAVQTSVTAVRDGSFEFTGNSPEPILIEILDNDYHVLGRAYVKNGDNLTLTLDRHNPYLVTAEGDDTNARWAEAMRASADTLMHASATDANAVIERYVAAHPDDVVSTLMFLVCYDSSVDPLRADSVLGSISPEVRPATLTAPYMLMSARWCREEAYAPVDTILYRTVAADSAMVYHPSQASRTVLAFSDETSHRADSVIPTLRSIAKAHPRKDDVMVLDMLLTVDTTTFKRTVLRDSATWTQAWAPGGVFARGIDRLALPAIPYYIVTDSAGRQLYRGTSPTAAAEAL